jgi:hypothetical protein
MSKRHKEAVWILCGPLVPLFVAGNIGLVIHDYGISHPARSFAICSALVGYLIHTTEYLRDKTKVPDDIGGNVYLAAVFLMPLLAFALTTAGIW